MRYFVDGSGAYIGAFDGAGVGRLIPAGAIEVPTHPPSRAHKWSGGAWAVDSAAKAVLDAEAAKEDLLAIDLSSIRDLREYIAAKPDAPKTLKDREALAVAARAEVVP